MLGTEVLSPPADQRLLRHLVLLLLDILEELYEFGIALFGSVIDLLDAHLRALGGFVEDAPQVEVGIAYGSELLRSLSGHCVEVTSLASCSLTPTFYTYLPTTVRGEDKHLLSSRRSLSIDANTQEHDPGRLRKILELVEKVGTEFFATTNRARTAPRSAYLVPDLG
jgi:hypothetical protein